jgi:cell division protein YceG involved in septum cleavage
MTDHAYAATSDATLAVISAAVYKATDDGIYFVTHSSTGVAIYVATYVPTDDATDAATREVLKS